MKIKLALPCPRATCTDSISALLNADGGNEERWIGEDVPSLKGQHGGDLEFVGECGAGHQIGFTAYPDHGRILRVFPHKHGRLKA